MKATLNFFRKSGLLWIVATVFVLIHSTTSFTADNCVVDNLADVPLDTKQQSAPGILMFLMDDSGSMDFATMVESKTFNGYNYAQNASDGQVDFGFGDRAYTFTDPGDDVYDRNFQGHEHLFWYTQFYITNKMYYNPHTTYLPWPKWNKAGIVVDAPTWTDSDFTEAFDMDPNNPRSNPLYDDHTLDMSATYDFGSFPREHILKYPGSIVIDDSETGTDQNDVIIDNCDAGFSKSVRDGGIWTTSGNGYDGGCGTVAYIADNSGEGFYTATWEASGVDTDAVFEAYAMWSAYDERGSDIPYTIYHDGGTTTIQVDQTDTAGQTDWFRLGTDTFTFSDGNIKVMIDDYEVTLAGGGAASNEVSADAVKFSCVSNCTGTLDPPFQATGPAATTTGWTTRGTDGDCLDGSYNTEGYYLRAEQEGHYTATWTTYNLDTATEYDIYVWFNDNTSDNSNSVNYKIYDDNTEIDSVIVNQKNEYSLPLRISTKLTFPSGTGRIKLDFNLAAGGDYVNADAVAFVPSVPDFIVNRHYYVHTGYDGVDNDGDGKVDADDTEAPLEDEIYLVNLNGDFEFYKVTEDANGMATNFETKTAAEAGLEWVTTRRTYDEECANFANWFSFYRRRELTAKNAIGNVVTDMTGLLVGYLTIHNRIEQEPLPVQVYDDGVNDVAGDENFWDETDNLLHVLYQDYTSSGGTPLRTSLREMGEFFKGNNTEKVPGDGNYNSIIPSDIYPSGTSAYTTSTYYPFFPPADGGACQQAFCIAMTDGFWNSDSPNVGNEDKDGSNNTSWDGGEFADEYENTLADVAMKYYETDLNSNLLDVVPKNTMDLATHQHMVTYGLSFGAKGSLDPLDYEDCPYKNGSCPDWPNPTSANAYKIDDLYHASVNGRGRFLNASNPEELLIAMDILKADIEARLGAAGAVATNSFQRIVGTSIYRGTYTTDTWVGDVKALKLNPLTGQFVNVDGEWSAQAQLDAQVAASSNTGWKARKIYTMTDYTMEFKSLQTNGINDDGDTDTDEADEEHTCPSFLSDGLDNDFDGMIDESRTNGVDDDLDGDTDEADEVADEDKCFPNFRTDNLDNDGDGFTDEEDEAYIVDYLRGDNSKTEDNGGNFRNRSHILGDIVHSAPVYHDGVVYIGANDGMLHAFDADDGDGDGFSQGDEIFAYIPRTILNSSNLPKLVNPDYQHKFFVDNTPYVKKIDYWDEYEGKWISDYGETLLVGGFGKGGKGIFCLNVGGATNGYFYSATFEYPPEPDDDMGYSYSKAYFAKTADPAVGWVVIFGNGYGSTNDEAVLYMIDIDNYGYITDAVFTNGVKKFKTGAAGCNGMSSPAIIDVEADGFVDYIYAGDLNGNLWKFDFNSEDHNDWGFAFMEGSSPKPMIKVTNYKASTTTVMNQPITVEPNVMRQLCDGGRPGYIVIFSTGQFLSEEDFTNDIASASQTFYGIWDFQEAWYSENEFGVRTNKYGVEYTSLYYGTFNADTGILDLPDSWDAIDWDGTMTEPITLLEQDAEFINDAFVDDTSENTDNLNSGWVILTDKLISWLKTEDYNNNSKPDADTTDYGNDGIDNDADGVSDADTIPDPDETSDDHVGWFFNQPQVGARGIRNPLIYPGAGNNTGIGVFISSIPSESPCEAGGISWLYQIDMCDGGRTEDAQFDYNNDYKVGGPGDFVEIDDPKYDDDSDDLPPTGTQFNMILYEPVVVDNNLYINTSTPAPPLIVPIPEDPEGMLYWWML
ncbi:MAG: hypothetical protein D3926_09970 [Desulfobacteraceae bacterium]|nr:MAG: hypothetical protein D3926_09970 [Desulfobacteraceae bacterium]